MDSPAVWLDDDEQDLWQALLTVVIALPAVLDRQLERDAGISNFEYSVLARLSEADKSTMRLSELARDCDGTLPRLSKVMVRFEASGWVARRPDANDGRYTLATLTKAGGKKVIASAPQHVARVRKLVFDPLSAGQRRSVGPALARIANAVRQELDAG